MESSSCGGNHSDSNVLLPPRKRLLAGFKKNQDSFTNSDHLTSNRNVVIDASFDALVKYRMENPNLSLEEIVEQSSRAAEEAVKAAQAARAVAEEKAVVAARAMVGAKSALDLVATISDEAYSQEGYLKKNKLKKNVPVKMFYDKHQIVENCNTDEELARQLHQAINSSPRISRNSNVKTNKNKKLKEMSTLEESRAMGDVDRDSDETDSEDLTGEEQAVVVVDKSTAKWNKDSSFKILNVQVESSHSKEGTSESSGDLSSIGRKRGRMKQKKLPLSICSFRDSTNTNEELKSKKPLLNEENNVPSSYVGHHPDSMMWKCKAFKAPVCVKQNKVTGP